jgi:hypothetical protein
MYGIDMVEILYKYEIEIVLKCLQKFYEYLENARKRAKW